MLSNEIYNKGNFILDLYCISWIHFWSSYFLMCLVFWLHFNQTFYFCYGTIHLQFVCTQIEFITKYCEFFALKLTYLLTVYYTMLSQFLVFDITHTLLKLERTCVAISWNISTMHIKAIYMNSSCFNVLWLATYLSRVYNTFSKLDWNIT